MRAAANGLEQAHRSRQCDGQTDRDIHIGAAVFECFERTLKKWLTSVNQNRQGDQRLKPVQKATGCVTHAIKMPSPNPDRQQHDVAGAKPGNSHRFEQTVMLLLINAAEPVGVKRHRLEPKLLQDFDKIIGPRHLAMPSNVEPPGGQIDPRLLHAIFMEQGLFDPPHTAAAMHTFNHQIDAVRIRTFGQHKALTMRRVQSCRGHGIITRSSITSRLASFSATKWTFQIPG